jgi:hypothetical protein
MRTCECGLQEGLAWRGAADGGIPDSRELRRSDWAGTASEKRRPET